MFITSRDCKDLSPEDAKAYILGYTVGNDVSCRMFQLPKNQAGQFFFSKAFDKFGPIGPSLVSPKLFADGTAFEVITEVNGQIRQRADFKKDMIFSPEKILSHMSQGWLFERSSLSIMQDYSYIRNRHHHSCWHGGHDGHARWCWSIYEAKDISERRRRGGNQDA